MIDKQDYIVVVENVKSKRKLYRMTCDRCHNDRGYQRVSRHGLGLCKVCVSSQIHTGKIVSQETRAKMKQNSYIGNGGTHHGTKHKDETKAKLSVAASKQNATYRKDFLYQNNNKTIQMRSGWELKYANYLDRQQIAWEYEPSFLLSDGKVYLPDFKLNDGTIVEIKGYFRPDAKIKWDRFCDEYADLNKVLLMKTDLQKLKII